MDKCKDCELFHNGCEFSEINNASEFVACGQIVKGNTSFSNPYDDSNLDGE